ncbi:MAG: sulfate reduction electron transfer complex DsrMKJOP subunit DsrM [candidate division Zixibacteria bacterium]|nr:sulfate reduction electron transfer complex DsrMKJOP subunit DsrM [candidate division Zixibacteria bacterium]
MPLVISLLAVIVLVVIALAGTGSLGLQYLFGVIFPYAALATFLIGLVYRVITWARSPVPFHIPTICGQQKSHSWIKHSKLESPYTTLGVIGRMALEIFFFRSLFRNTKVDLKKGPRLVYGSEKYLWMAGMAFHYSFLIILLRHLRFFAEPVPFFVTALQTLDGFFQIWLPIIYITDGLILAALLFLLFRRLYDVKLRYLSMAGDYFPLFLLLGIAITGYLMRYTTAKADLVEVKELAMGLLSFRPVIPAGLDSVFYLHIFLVSVLIAYFPFSKLLHMAGVFMSPTRNLANNSRAKRHINPWNYDVKVHTYEEYEDEFRDVMKAAGMPVEKE